MWTQGAFTLLVTPKPRTYLRNVQTYRTTPLFSVDREKFEELDMFINAIQ